MKLLLTAATEAELGPILQYLQQNWASHGPNSYKKAENSLDICITGVGMVATTYQLGKALQKESYDFALQAGVGGSYDRGIALGEVLLISSEQYGDMGAQDHYNYLDIFELGLLGKDEKPFKDGKLPMPKSGYADKIQLKQATALTVNTVTGTDFTAKGRWEKFGCQVESMEGFAFHYVCLQEGVAFAQIRAISNYVEARDKNKWQMKDAIINLNNRLIEIIEGLQ